MYKKINFGDGSTGHFQVQNEDSLKAAFLTDGIFDPFYNDFKSATREDNDPQKDKLFDKIYRTLMSRYYSELDDAHGRWHIDTCIQNVCAFYFKAKQSSDYKVQLSGCTVYDLMVMMLFHDLGLSKKVAKACGHYGAETREYHHIVSRKAFDMIYGGQISDSFLGVNSDDLHKLISGPNTAWHVAEGIQWHRASRPTNKEYDIYADLARCADGFNDAHDIAERSLIYNRKHHPDFTKEQVVKAAFDHQRKKYDSSKGYAANLPLPFVQKEYKRNLILLQEILNMDVDYIINTWIPDTCTHFKW